MSRMFNLGSKEILIIALVILFLFGSKKLTEWAKELGEAGKELKKAKNEFSSALDETDEEIKEDKKLKTGKEEKVTQVQESEDV